jgi:hypothetical protein
METAREFTECSLHNNRCPVAISDNYRARNQMKLIHICHSCWGNSLGIVIRLWAGQLIIRFQFLQGQEIFYLHLCLEHYLTDRRLSTLLNQSGCCGDKKHHLPLLEIKLWSHSLPACSLATILTNVYFRYDKFKILCTPNEY